MSEAKPTAHGSALTGSTAPSLVLPKVLLFLVLALGVAGPALGAIRLGPFSLFPYRLLFPVLLIVFAFRAFDRHGRLDLSGVRVRAQLQFLGFWLVYGCITLVWAPSTADAVEDLIFLFMSASIIAIAVFTLRSLRDLDRFFRFWLLLLAAINLIGLWELRTGQHLPMSKSNEVFFDHDLPTCVFRNPNDFATVLTLGLPFAIAWIGHVRTLLPRLAGLAMVLSSLTLVLATGSRANVIAIMVGGLFWFALLLPPRKKAATLLAAVVVAVLLAAALPNAFRERVEEVGEELGTVNVERLETSGTSLNIRKNLIANALGLVVDSYGFGVGAGNVEHRIEQQSANFTAGIVNVHNWWVEILANYGVVVFAGYVVFFLSILTGLFRARRLLIDEREKRIAEALLFGLVAFSVASTSSSSVMTLRPQWFFFAFALAFLDYVRNLPREARP